MKLATAAGCQRRANRTGAAARQIIGRRNADAADRHTPTAGIRQRRAGDRHVVGEDWHLAKVQAGRHEDHATRDRRGGRRGGGGWGRCARGRVGRGRGVGDAATADATPDQVDRMRAAGRIAGDRHGTGIGGNSLRHIPHLKPLLLS